MNMKRNGHIYGRWFWLVENGQVEIWENLSDDHLSNLYCFFKSKSDQYYEGALKWIESEAKRRGAIAKLRNVDIYGCYPYFDYGVWVVFDKTSGGVIPLKGYDLNKIPPDVRDKFVVLEMLGLL
jgi:hypothetical protein